MTIKRRTLEQLNPEILKKVKDGELHILVCNHQKNPAPVCEIALSTCDLCNGEVWLDAANLPRLAELGMAKVCIPCYTVIAPSADEYRAMIGGQQMTIEEGFRTAAEMIDPKPKDEAN